MTEQEFRDALKSKVGHAGLSSDRQLKVLARMKGEEPKVRTWNKMKVSLVLALVVMMSMGAAVATEIIDYVNWKGEPVTAPQHDLGDQAAILQRMRELCVIPDDSMMAIVSRATEAISGQVIRTGSEEISERFGREETMAELILKDGTLPWPTGLSEQYEMHYGMVKFGCSAGGSYETVSQETTQDGYIVSLLTIPEEHRKVLAYDVRYWGENYKDLNISLRAMTYAGSSGVYVSEGCTVIPLTVEGVENALFITNGKKNKLTMQGKLAVPAGISRVGSKSDGSLEYYSDELTHYALEITTTDLGLTAADLLAIFGLAAQ